MKIPYEMRIKLDEHQSEILNTKEILDYIDVVTDKYLLEYYIKAITNEPILNKEMLKEILDKANERLNSLKGINSLQDLFKVAEKETDKLNDISIIDTPAEMNDKIDGLRKDVTYIKIKNGDSNELLEVENVDKVKKFLNNKEFLKEMNRQEIIGFLKENSNKIDTKEIDTRKSDELNSDALKKEINDISNPYLRDIFMQEQNVILKERVEINKYVKTNMPEVKIEYGLNSNGERIYIAGDKIIKFEGKERNMRILSSDEVERKEINSSNFEQYKKGKEVNGQELEAKYDNIYSYDGKEDLLNTIIDAIMMNFGVTNDQIKFLTGFLDKCVENEELGYTNPGNLQEVFDYYYEYAKTSPEVVNDEIKEIFERKEKLLNKTDENEYEKDYNVEHTKVLRFVPNKKDDLAGLDKAAFVSVAIILETSLVGTLLFALLALVK